MRVNFEHPSWKLASRHAVALAVRRAMALPEIPARTGVLALGLSLIASPALGQAFPPAFELRSLFPAAGGDGSAGFVVNGIDASDYSGISVSGAGDVNGDGIDDVIIGANQADPNGQSAAGESYVVFGRTSGIPATFELRSLFPAAGGDGSEGFVLKGVDASDLSGRSISGAGDFNGDGIDDLIIGAYAASPYGRSYAGESYVVFGRSTGFAGIFDLGSLFPAAGGDGSEGFVLNGVGAYDVSGASVSGAGDINGDGLDDLIIGARSARPNGQSDTGASYVVFGRTTGFPATFELGSLLPDAGGDGSDGFVLNGVNANDLCGASVGGAGDINGDGIDDLVIGAYFADPNGNSYAGESYVVFGRTTGFAATFELRSLFPAAGGDGSTGFVLKGVDAGDVSGWAVSGVGDINGDGIDDLAIGATDAGIAPDGQDRTGESYVVFGRSSGFPAAFELRSLFPAAGGDGNEGFVLKGADGDDISGTSISGMGDINDDGIGDLIIGARGAAPNGQVDAGESYLVFGRSTGFPAAFELRSLFPAAGGDGSKGFVLKGVDAGDVSGFSVSIAGDVNGDGIADVVIGAFRGDPRSRSAAGQSYVVFGRQDDSF